jgi:hypothetical protein
MIGSVAESPPAIPFRKLRPKTSGFDLSLECFLHSLTPSTEDGGGGQKLSNEKSSPRSRLSLICFSTINLKSPTGRFGIPSVRRAVLAAVQRLK